jgi:hypothetical protein
VLVPALEINAGHNVHHEPQGAHDVFLALHIVVIVPPLDRRDPAFIKFLSPLWKTLFSLLNTLHLSISFLGKQRACVRILLIVLSPHLLVVGHLAWKRSCRRIQNRDAQKNEEGKYHNGIRSRVQLI